MRHWNRNVPQSGAVCRVPRTVPKKQVHFAVIDAISALSVALTPDKHAARTHIISHGSRTSCQPALQILPNLYAVESPQTCMCIVASLLQLLTCSSSPSIIVVCGLTRTRRCFTFASSSSLLTPSPTPRFMKGTSDRWLFVCYLHPYAHTQQTINYSFTCYSLPRPGLVTRDCSPLARQPDFLRWHWLDSRRDSSLPTAMDHAN